MLNGDTARLDRVDAASADPAARIADLEGQLARRTVQLDEARRALDREFLDNAAAPSADGHALSARLNEVVRELHRISEQLESRNAALATANWRLEQRVAERTAALEAALDAKRDSEARFRRVADGVPQLLWTSHPEGRWDYASRRWVAYTGQAEKDSHDLGWLECVHPDDREPTMTAWHAAVKAAKPLFVEFRLRGADGEYRWFETQAMPMVASPDDARSPDAQWVGSCSDIHARKLAEQMQSEANAALEAELVDRRQELAESEARFRAFFQIAPEPLFVVIVAPDGRFLHEAFNAPFERLTGFHEDQAHNQESNRFMLPETALVFETHYRLCKEGGVPHVFDALVTLPTGDRTLRITLVPTLGGNGASEATQCLFGSVRDMSNTSGALLSPNLDA